MGFVKFEGRSRVWDRATPTVSLHNTGMFALNKCARGRYLKHNKYAILYFDKERDVIGIELRKKKSENTYKINVSNYMATISGKEFLKYHKIKKQRGSFECKWNEEYGLVEFGGFQFVD